MFKILQQHFLGGKEITDVTDEQWKRLIYRFPGRIKSILTATKQILFVSFLQPITISIR